MSEQELDAFLTAGFTKEQILEVVAIVEVGELLRYWRQAGKWATKNATGSV